MPFVCVFDDAMHGRYDSFYVNIGIWVNCFHPILSYLIKNGANMSYHELPLDSTSLYHAGWFLFPSKQHPAYWKWGAWSFPAMSKQTGLSDFADNLMHFAIISHGHLHHPNPVLALGWRFTRVLVHLIMKSWTKCPTDSPVLSYTDQANVRFLGEAWGFCLFR